MSGVSGFNPAGLTREERAKLKSLGFHHIKERAPTVNDDVTEGVKPKDKWLDTDGVEAYICFDNTEGAAVWKNTSLELEDLSDLFAAKISHDLATAENDFLVGAPTPFGTFVKKTLAEVKTILAWVLDSTAEAVGFTISGGTTSKTLTVTESTTLGGGAHSGTNTGDNPGVTAVSGTAPLASSGGTTPAISLVNNAGSPADITAVDVGALADSDTVVPTSKAVKTVTDTKATLDTDVSFTSVDLGGDIETTALEYVIAEAKDASGNVIAKIAIEFDDLGEGTQNGVMRFYVQRAGTLTNVLELDGGV